ncbi:CDP-alcohol phosphatidyltransferase family protein [Corynebacterium testudinoris]|uniref:Phosphatidylglycerophosphate synthase n=1 Tax=Corynebacterium testudinoris TaxID=136857 RepID=A0A0G3H9R1_9CORY|nr:CDP-alcohol phosphatidyltransferase family protein [Corynebacterium testudinoris]AKK07872.1 phosphatidylglycerophosphate synthase [Corynebacterium testudinoris]MBX8996793.1 CDP-alcohol phosphatidyltransferase family protein [Corynebacterium testudinoris]
MTELPQDSWRERYRWARTSLDGAQKTGQGVPAYTRWVNRRGARVVAAVGYACGWTPNMVTAMSALLSLAGMILLLIFPPAAWLGVPVAALLAAGYLFDSADGQLARLSGRSSKTGEWIDHVVDAFRSPAIHLVTAVAIMIYRPDSWWLALVALGYSLITSGQFLSQILAEAFVKKAGRPQTRGGDKRSWILLPTDPGTLCWSFILWGVSPLFAVVYTLLAAIAAAHSAVSLRRRFRDLSALDNASSQG